MRGLYAIADIGALSARGLDPAAFIEAVLCASPAALQLRAKDVPAREALGILRAVGPMCRGAGVPLVANDRPDLAILAGCDLVHVGQTDMPIDLVRRIAPGIGVGVSTHSLDQLDAALATRPTYAAFGPVFETTSKLRPDPVVGIAALHAAAARARLAGVPLVAIGGITVERARELADAVDAVAVISGLLPAPSLRGARAPSREWTGEVAARARAFQDALAPRAVAAGGGR